MVAVSGDLEEESCVEGSTYTKRPETEANGGKKTIVG